MKNGLARDIFIVFAVWFVASYVFSGFPWSMVPSVMFGVGIIWIIGLSAGAAATWFRTEGGLLVARRSLARDAVDDTGDAVAKVMDADPGHTLHVVPLPVIGEPEKGAVRVNRLSRQAWWSDYEKAHPLHARVIEEVYAVMESKPGLPASPGNGHGGASLIQHSMNVVVSMLAIAPQWAFKGIVNKTGKVIVPLHSGATELRIAEPSPLGSPLLPVLAFAHDVGKVPCYIMEDGRVVGEIPGHGERGAALLRRLDSVQALPMEDRDCLLLAVEFYHHLSDMPTSQWISDSIRSMTALLYLADCDASEFEGDSADNAIEARRLYAPESLNSGTTPPKPTAPASEPAAVAPPAAPTTPAAADTTTPADSPPAETTAAAATPASDPAPGEVSYETENGATALDVFMEAITTPDAVNGKNKSTRVAWKHSEWIYVQISTFIEAAALIAKDYSILKAGRELFLASLLRDLGKQGVLLTEHEGEVRAPRDAVWTVRSAGSDGTIDASRPYETFIVSTSLAPHLPGLADCRYAPTIVDARHANDEGAAPAANAPAAKSSAEAALDLLDAIDPLPTLPEVHGRTIATPPSGLPDGFVLGTRKGTAAKPGADPDRLAQRATGAESTPMIMHSCNTKPLDLAILKALFRTGSTEYGMEVRTIGKTKLVVFDGDLIAKDYTFDVNSLPDGIKYIAEKRRLVVTA